MSKTLKPVPECNGEAEEREYWATHDSHDHLDWSHAREAVFPELWPTLRTISIRVAEPMLARRERCATRHERTAWMCPTSL